MLLADTSTTTYHLTDGILISRIKDGAHLTIDSAKENAAARSQFNLEKPVPGLMDLRNLERMSFEALMATTEAAKREPFVAAAILFSEVNQQIIAKEASIFHQAPFPLKSFDNEEKAMKWLRTFI